MNPSQKVVWTLSSLYRQNRTRLCLSWF